MSAPRGTQRTKASRIQNGFLRRLASEEHGEGLFNHVPGCLFLIKDKAGRFIRANQALLEKFGLKSESELVGKTDFELMSVRLAENFKKDDMFVVNSGLAILNKMEMVPGADRQIDWHITTKIPLRGKDGSVIGVAGVVRYFKKGDMASQPFSEMAAVVNHIQSNYCAVIKVSHLAKLANLSVSAFERKFARLFGMTPVKYILITRVKDACHRLTSSDMTVAEIALSLGFADQSHLTREFAKIMGVGPGRYRANHPP